MWRATIRPSSWRNNEALQPFGKALLGETGIYFGNMGSQEEHETSLLLRVARDGSDSTHKVVRGISSVGRASRSQ